jgi:tetratricopeptide (TPR) repeat protein
MSTRIGTVSLLCIVLLISNGCASGPPPSPVEMGEADLASGDWRSAKSHFAEALRVDPASGRAWLGQARAQLVGRDPEGALRSLSSLSRIDRAPFSGEARSTYVDSLRAATSVRLAREQSEAALVAARALVKLEPNRQDLDQLLGRALIAEAERRRWLGDQQAALSLYREATHIVPNTLDAWIGAAEILIELKQGRQAMKLLEVARKTHPTAGQIRSLTIQALDFR